MTYCSKHLLSACFSISFLLTACQEAKHPPGVPAADATAQAAMDGRSRLIVALTEVRRLVVSKDSQQTAMMFRFPIADSYFSLSGDSIFESEKAKNGDRITRAMFLSGYGQLVQELQFQELDSAFRDIDINKLKTADSLGFVDSSTIKGCIHGYSIRIEKDSLVEFDSYGYPVSDSAREENNDMKCGDYLLVWEFVFDGKRLYMTSHSEGD
jgi:hypothetical protein